MSYDLMVFEPDAAPREHSDFMEWCAKQTKWGEDHGYNDPALSSEHLRAWFNEIVQVFPPMNGPFTKESLAGDEAFSSDYAIGADFIYASFAWSRAEPAYLTVARLAEKYRLGLFNASSSGEEVWLPENGQMVLAHDKSPPGIVGRIMDMLNLNK